MVRSHLDSSYSKRPSARCHAPYIGYRLPVLHTALVDGSSEGSEHLDDNSDADADADARGPPQQSMLYDLDTLDSTTHPHAARAIQRSSRCRGVP